MIGEGQPEGSSRSVPLFRGEPITPQDLGPSAERVTGVPEDEAAYALLLEHTMSCVVCNAFRECEVGDELRAVVRRDALAVLGSDAPPGEASYRTLRISDESGIHEVARVEVDACSWCRKSDDGLVVVGVLHSDSGPGWDICACSWCVRRHDLLPLADHPEGSWCIPMHRDGIPAAIPHPEL